MIRGTTPTFRFSLPEYFIKENIKEIFIPFSQSGRILVEKNINDISFENNIAIVHLSQKETLSFRECLRIKAQVIIKDKNDDVFRSKDIWINSRNTIKDGEI